MLVLLLLVLLVLLLLSLPHGLLELFLELLVFERIGDGLGLFVRDRQRISKGSGDVCACSTFHKPPLHQK